MVVLGCSHHQSWWVPKNHRLEETFTHCFYSYDYYYYSCAVTRVYSHFSVSTGLGLCSSSLNFGGNLKSPWRLSLLIQKDPFA